jgi:glycosyltransferase involved in cell wall biosynthesis
MVSYLDQSNIIAGVAALLSRTEIIISSFRNHNPENFGFYQSWYKRYYKMLVKSGRVSWTGNSNSGNASYIDWANIDPANVKLIRNGLNFRNICASNDGDRDLRDLYGLKGHKVICGVFRLSHEKSPMLFLEVVAEVIGRMKGVKAIILGDGPYAMDMQAEILRNNLQDSVLLLGRKKNVSAYVEISNVVLQTSRMEGTPNSLIEAQYLRKPVVTTDAGGSSEAVDDGKSGYVLPLNEKEPLVDAILTILSDDKVAMQMGEYGHSFVKERFSISRMVDEYIDLIQEGASTNLADAEA